MKHNFKLTLAFDGTNYQGWQKQKTTDRTVQETLEKAIAFCLQEDVKLIGSGRTDAGVHAEAMAAHFVTEKELPENFLGNLNAKLPEDIKVFRVEEMELSFHARLYAKGKIYRYQIDTREKAGVFRRKYACHYVEPLNVAEMKKAAEFLVGTHDFSAFTMDKTKDKSKIRTVHRIDLEEKDGLLTIRFRGNGFLYNMVRIMTGTLIEVGIGKKKAADIPGILESKERKNAGFLAPAQGLVMEKVLYK